VQKKLPRGLLEAVGPAQERAVRDSRCELRYNFEWDPAKAKDNLRKHRVSFERAAELFLDPLAVSILDLEHGEEEERWVTMGTDSQGILLVVIHTFAEASAEEWKIRVISARRATRREAKHYEESKL
jgi:uncharacterized DUF497 family protein